jgi:two-component sensor histidine kinase
MTEKSPRILLVQDNPTDVADLRTWLPSSGPGSFHIESVTRLSEALLLLKDTSIDLILLDLDLPDNEGLSTFQQLRQATPGIPVIVFAGTDDQELAAIAAQAGAQNFLVKGQLNAGLLTRAVCFALARGATETALRTSLREKDVLLKEIHHRVKNNLQIMSSLLFLQVGNSEQPLVKAALKDVQNRVLSMALIHDHLYRSRNLADVDMVAYLKSLCEQLCRLLITTPGTIRLHLDLAPVHMGVDQAIPCGLLANELITNALKHAFPQGRGGNLRIALQHADGGQMMRLCVADDGVGLPPGFSLEHLTSLGLQVTSDLARQLGGVLEIEAGPGTRVGLVFPLHQP